MNQHNHSLIHIRNQKLDYHHGSIAEMGRKISYTSDVMVVTPQLHCHNNKVNHA